MKPAIVINTTDKYSHIWDTWYHYYKKYWHLDYPVYFLNEAMDISYPFNQIKVDIPELGLWTKKLRESVEQIPEEHLFILLEDLLFTDGFATGEFEHIYKCLLKVRGDAMRIQPESKYTITHTTLEPNIRKLAQYSPYLIAHTPNIGQRDFLLECIKEDEDPWTNELEGTKRIHGKGYNIYHYEKTWFANVLRHGKLDPQYLKLMNV